MIKTLLVFSIVAMVSACSSTRPKSEEQKTLESRHAIYISEDGNIKLPNGVTGNQSPLDLRSKDEKYVEDIITHIGKVRESKPELKVVVFIHGGLNTTDNVWKRVELFSEAMLKENRYPIFVGWNSGGVANYFDHLLRLRQGERVGAFKGWATSPFVLLSDVGRSVARIPAGIIQAGSDLAIIPISFKGQVENDYQTRMNRVGARFHDKPVDEWEGGEFNVTSRGSFTGTGQYITAVNPVKFIVAPFLDGLGSGAWDSMLRRTDLVLSKRIAFSGTIEKGTPENFGDTAVTMLLKGLEMQQQKEREARTTPIGIDLIGHSMGAIVINNILTRHPLLEVDNVVFMGAAAPVKDVENVVVPWLRRPPKAGQPRPEQVRFYSLSIDQYREMSENFFWDFVPRGSLLYWVDNIFGEVNSFKDRTAGSWWNIIRAAEDVFPPDVRSQVHLSRFSIGGAESGPQEHGEFDAYYFWRKEFWCAERGLAKFNPKVPAPAPRIRQESACTTLKPPKPPVSNANLKTLP